jgi:surface antigen
MYNQSSATLSLSKFKFVWASLVVTAFILIFSATVTASGLNKSLEEASRATSRASVASYDTTNIVTNGLGTAATASKRAGIAIGMGFYDLCHGITKSAAQGGHIVASIGSNIARGISSGVTAVATGIGHGTVAVATAPVKAVRTVADGQVVNAMIRPSTDDEVPMIDGETSSAVLDKLEAEQRAQIAQLLEEQKVANQALAGSVLNGDHSRGGYPAKWDSARQDSLVDDWGMFNRECVSYAAWKVYQTYGNMPFWGGIGNANQWVRNARNAGIPTGSVPKVGSVAISMAGYYGHAMWVEAVNGNMIYISQYNYDLRGHYSEMWIDGRNLTYIYFN